MPRDYKSHVTRKQKNSLPGYIWLLSGLGIGLFVAFIIYLDKQPENETDFGEAVQLELEKLKKQANKQQDNNQESEPDAHGPEETTTKKKEQKFNFYTLLPELEVLIPESETRPPENKRDLKATKKDKVKITDDNTTSSNKQFVLQVGSFQNLSDAEKLKANLAFLGLTANIQHVTVNRQSWHRVRTGPYKNKQQLYKNQKKLKRNDIHSIPVELK